MNTEDMDMIYRGLLAMDVFMTKEHIRLLDSTLKYAVDRGDINHRDGHYVATQIMTQVLGFNRGMWKVLKERHPSIMEFVKTERLTGWGDRGGSAPNVITRFGVFYLAALNNYKGAIEKGSHPPTLYIYRDPGNKALKVGVTVDLSGRRKNSTAANPFLILTATFEIADVELERRLQRYLQPHAIANCVGWYPDTAQVREKINRFMLDNDVIDKPHPSLVY